MGTRSLTILPGFDGQETAVLYRQMDGYPSGHGRELAEFLAGSTVVNGLAGDSGKVFNGPDCLSASIVASFKDGPGGIYLMRADTRDVGEEYRYTLSIPDNHVSVKVESGYGEEWETIFDGTADAMLAWTEGQE